MPLLPIDLPPGFYSNGTELQSTGRWREGNLVRWRDKALRPIGGWGDAFVEDAGFLSYSRGAWAYSFSSDIVERALFAGNATSLIGVVTNAVGVGLPVYIDGLTGYQDQTGDNYATTWALDNFGTALIACSDSDGRIFAVSAPQDNATTAVISAAPTNVGSIIVTDERFLFALGAEGEPARLDWCDREDYTTWTPLATNEAESRLLQTSGRLMQGIRVRGQTLLLTDRDAHTATYVGPPIVYATERVGSSCGTISRKAATMAAGGAFWMGTNGFYAYSGGSVTPLDCPVSDRVFGELALSQASKVWAFDNSEFNEVWWFYPTGTEISRYVSYNYLTGEWGFGFLSRTTGVARGVFEKPHLFQTNGTVSIHEIGFDYGEAVPFALTGPISFGDRIATATSLIPDEAFQGGVTATFYTRLYPNAAQSTHGPYTMDAPTDVRFTGRQFQMRVDGEPGENWRVGINRLDIRPRGKR